MRGVLCSIVVVLVAGCLNAAEHRGLVKFGTLPVPGAAVTTRQGDKTVAVLTDAQGVYVFPDLAEGAWTLQVEMRGFAPLKRDIQIPADGVTTLELSMLPLAEITEAGATVEVRAA